MAGWTTGNSDLRTALISLSNSDIFCVNETHLLRDTQLSVEGYRYFGHNRTGVHVNANKGSGGVGIFIKDTFFKNYVVSVVDKDYEGILGIKLCNKHSDYTCIVYSCYLPPETSPWGRDGVSFFDKLPYEFLKNDTIIKALHKLYLLCFSTGKVPGEWLRATISPIPKSAQLDKCEPLNYRGISLLCTSAKIYSSILNSRVMAYLENNNLLVEEQNGFRRNRACIDHVFSLASILQVQTYFFINFYRMV